jgi:4-hydroxy-tetrahydrodipicolinate synthase
MAGQLLNEAAKGVFIIAATPFAESGALDLASLDRLTDFYLGHGVHGITLLGMMGEAQKLDDVEARAVMRRVIARVGGRVPVVVGVSHAGLADLAALAADAMAAGAAGVMVAPLAGLKGDEGVYTYFEQVFRALDAATPVVFQDYPQSTGVHLTTTCFGRLVDAFPMLVMLKHEDCPGLGKLSRIRAEAARDRRRRVSILVGNGGLYYPQELQRGADGAMTGFAYPEMLVGVHTLHAAGDIDGAEDLFDAYLPLVRHEQQPGIGLALRKEVLRRRGAIASAKVRAPGPSLTSDDLRELERLMARVERAAAAHPTVRRAA